MSPEPPVVDDENPEWTAADFARAKPLSGAPAEVQAAFRKIGRPRKADAKRLVSLRLDPAVIEHFKAGGPGWQSRINAVLAQAVAKSVRR